MKPTLNPSASRATFSINYAPKQIIEAYLSKEIVRKESYRIIVSLLRPRYERILVVREDGGQSQVSVSNNTGLVGFNTETSISSGRSATGQVVELPVGENDVLNALARTGGLPGPSARQEVIIFRKREKSTGDNTALELLPTPDLLAACEGSNADMIRIPLKVRPGMPLMFKPEDIILKTGDIVTVRGLEPELYYTGGLIPAGENQLPYDRDMSVIEAVLKARGPLISGGLSTSNLSGSIVGSGLGNPSPSLVSIIRKTTNGSQINIRVDLNEALRDPDQNILVQAEDVLILQENTDESMSRYFTSRFQLNLFFRYLNRTDATGTGTVLAP